MLQNFPGRNAFLVVGRIDQADSAVETGRDEPALLLEGGPWIITQLLDKRMPSQAELGMFHGVLALAVETMSARIYASIC